MVAFLNFKITVFKNPLFKKVAAKSTLVLLVDRQCHRQTPRGRYTLENRANKVKERILGCDTNNELMIVKSELNN